MLPLVTAVFLASVLGSLHCVGMCGAFLALAFNDCGEKQRWKVVSAYHGGRLITYVLLGLAGGAVGSILDLAGGLAGLQRVALPLAGVTVIAFSLVTVLRHRGIRVVALRLPARWVRGVGRLQQFAMSLSPLRRAMGIGLLTTLLPCGWLYAFVATAAGTGHPVQGGLVMAVFWSGTLPALIAVGEGIQSFAGPLANRLPLLTCVILMLFGGWAIAGRSHMHVADLVTASSRMHVVSEASSSVSQLPCHTAPAPRFDIETGFLIEAPASLCGASSPAGEELP